MWRRKNYLKVTTFIASTLLSISCIASSTPTTSASFDMVNNVLASPFGGFGAFFWPCATCGSGTSATAVRNLYAPGSNLNFIRQDYEMRNSKQGSIPNNLTYDQYLNGWTPDPNNPGATIDGWIHTTDALVDVRQPNIQYLWWPPMPPSFLSNGVFISAQTQNFIYYLAAGITQVNNKLGSGTLSNIYSLNYTEIINEPDCNNGNGCQPWMSNTDYNNIITGLRAYLNTLAPVPPTQIIGAGVSHIDGVNGSTWLAGTDAFTSAVISGNATSALGGWDVHSYTWGKASGTNIADKESVACSGSSTICKDFFGNIENGWGQGGVRYLYHPWYAGSSNSPFNADPTYPVLITELNTKALTFHGHTYSSENANSLCLQTNHSDCTVAYTVPYGVRLYNDVISFLAQGVQNVTYWEGVDQNWEGSGGGWGLIDINGHLKPAYTALQPLFSSSFLPVGANVLVSPSTQPGNDVYSVGFKFQNSLGETCVTTANANGTNSSASINRTITLTNVPAPLSTVTPIVAQKYAQSAAGTTYVYNPVVSNVTLTSGNGTSAGTYNYNSSTNTFKYTVNLPQDSTMSVVTCF